MATASTLTYNQKGLRESLQDIIYDISPTETPFISSIGRDTAEATFEEWQTNTLDAAAANAQIEGDDATFAAAQATTRLGNRTQILRKTWFVSGTLDRVSKAGRAKETAYQMTRSMKAIKRDLEFAACQNQAATAGVAASARTMAGMETWIFGSNRILGSGGTGGSTVPVTS